jgi:hypothetical protein
MEMLKGYVKMNKSEQIEWIVDWCKEQIVKNGNVYLDSNNLDLMQEFDDFTGLKIKLSHSLWKSRIRDAAKFLGLNGARSYAWDASPSAGIPKYTMVYSHKEEVNNE